MFSTRLFLAVRATRCIHSAFYRHQRPALSRMFSVTPRQQAEEDPEAIVTAFKNTTIFKKLADNTAALKALEDFGKAMKNTGIEITPGKRPTATQMVKLSMNGEFRASITQLAEEMKKAGIDITSPEVMAEVMGFMKPGEK